MEYEHTKSRAAEAMGRGWVSVSERAVAKPGSSINGVRYLVIPGFYDPKESAEMLGRARELLDEFDPSGHPMVRLEGFCLAEEMLTL